MSSYFLYALLILAGLGAVAGAVCRAGARGHRPWLPLAIIWLAVAVTPYVIGSARTIRPAEPLMLLAPLGVAALVADAEVRRGCSLWWAGSLAVVLGAAVAAVTPFLVAYLSLMLECVTTGYCRF